jgi:hypothetical protein
MNNTLPLVTLSFRAYFMRIHGPAINPTVRVLLVEATGAQIIYERSGSWSQCERWMAKLTNCVIAREDLAVVRKRLEQKRLASINEVRTSQHDLDSVGFRRADS